MRCWRLWKQSTGHSGRGSRHANSSSSSRQSSNTNSSSKVGRYAHTLLHVTWHVFHWCCITVGSCVRQCCVEQSTLGSVAVVGCSGALSWLRCHWALPLLLCLQVECCGVTLHHRWQSTSSHRALQLEARTPAAHLWCTRLHTHWVAAATSHLHLRQQVQLAALV